MSFESNPAYTTLGLVGETASALTPPLRNGATRSQASSAHSPPANDENPDSDAVRCAASGASTDHRTPEISVGVLTRTSADAAA